MSNPKNKKPESKMPCENCFKDVPTKTMTIFPFFDPNLGDTELHLCTQCSQLKTKIDALNKEINQQFREIVSKMNSKDASTKQERQELIEVNRQIILQRQDLEDQFEGMTPII